MSAENLAELKKYARRKNFTYDDVTRIRELGRSGLTHRPAIDLLKKIDSDYARNAVFSLVDKFMSYEDGLKFYADNPDDHSADCIGGLAGDKKRGAEQILALEYIKNMKGDSVTNVITGIAGPDAKNKEVPVRALEILETIDTPDASRAIAIISSYHSETRNRALEILEKRPSEEQRDRAIQDVLVHTLRGMKTPVALLDAFTHVSTQTVRSLHLEDWLKKAADKVIDLPVMIEAAQKDPERLQDVMNRASDMHPDVVSKKVVMATRQAIALAKSYSELLLEKR